MTTYQAGEMYVRLTDSINVNFLIRLLSYNYASYHHWEKLGKVYIHRISIVTHSCVWIYNDLKPKKIFKCQKRKTKSIKLQDVGQKYKKTDNMRENIQTAVRDRKKWGNSWWLVLLENIFQQNRSPETKKQKQKWSLENGLETQRCSK